MTGSSPEDYFSSPNAPPVGRFNFVWSFVLSLRDPDLPGEGRYFVLRHNLLSRWRDHTLFCHAVKNQAIDPPIGRIHHFRNAIGRLSALPALSRQAVDEAVRRHFWDRFRLALDPDDFGPVPGARPRHLIYQSKSHGVPTACQFNLYRVHLEGADLRTVVEHPEAAVFPEVELRRFLETDRFSNQVRLLFEPGTYEKVQALPVPTLSATPGVVEPATVLFSDMKDFSTVVLETHGPLEPHAAISTFTRLCKRYQLALVRSVRANEGEVIHTAGDAVFAVFRGEDTAARAYQSCRAIFAAVEELRKDTEFSNLKRHFTTRIGLATGDLLFGYLGPLELKESTAFGQVVNVGARLEAAVKDFANGGGGVLLDAQTYESLPEPVRADLREVTVTSEHIKELGDETATCYLRTAT